MILQYIGGLFEQRPYSGSLGLVGNELGNVQLCAPYCE